MIRFDCCALLLRFGLCAVAFGMLAIGCSPRQNTSTAIVRPDRVSEAPAVSTAKETQTSDKASVKNAVASLLERDSRSDHVFPSGVQVKSVKVSDGIATIDFSHEFSELANSGETVESDAQHALRKALSRFESIDKMRVTVEGKPFESQAADWNTAFPVREHESGSGRTAPDLGSASASR
jgi:hypothetical protein